MNPEYSNHAAASRLATSAVHALSVYVSLGDKALELIAAGDLDAAEPLLNRRKAVLHNFRVIDVRVARIGYPETEAARIDCLGQAAMSIDAAVRDALVSHRNFLREEMVVLAGRKKIGNYKSGHSDPPVVETGI